MPNYDYDDAAKTVAFIKNFTDEQLETAIISGSGLGDIVDAIEDKKFLDPEKFPVWPRSTAPGHSGKIITGKIHGRNVIMLQGRVHFYEGYSMKAVTFPTRVIAMLGVKNFIATNASGAINKNFSAGDIIAVRDHINFMGTNPLIGENDERWNARFPDMSNAYNREMLKILENMGLKTGVYISFTGPSFETPAEIKTAEIMGADLAGMSTVPEVIVANSMGLKVAVLSCVANMAAGINPDAALTGEEVLDNMKKISEKLAKIIVDFIGRLD